MKTKTIKTIKTLQKCIQQSFKNKNYDIIVYEPGRDSKMAKMDIDLFSFINSDNINVYKRNMPKIIFKNLSAVGAMLNNPVLEDWILDKISFENDYPISFHGIFRHNTKFTRRAIKCFYNKYRSISPSIYGTSQEFLNINFMPEEFDDLAMLYLTLNFLRLKNFDMLDFRTGILVSPNLEFDETMNESDKSSYIQKYINQSIIF